MHPAIGDLVSDLYYQGRLQSAAPPADRLRIVEREPFPGHPLVVVDMAGTQHRCERHGQSSRINRVSAEAAVHLATSSAHSGATVAIITPYAAQARLIRPLVAAGAPSSEITCATVHRFQGAEADVVIIDLVDAAPLPPGRLLNDQSSGSAARALLNVSVSRARARLIVLADLAYFHAQGSSAVVDLLRCLEQRGWTCSGRLIGRISQGSGGVG
jgi:superfamily I DNA and/or RNA helicase